MTDNTNETDNNDLRNNVHSQCPNNMGQNKQLYSSNLERDKYIQSLNAWINEAWQWQNYALRAPYYYLLNQQIDQASTNNVNYSRRPNLANNTQQNRTSTTGTEEYEKSERFIKVCVCFFFVVLSPTEGLVFSIPPVWKRILAECVDFIILFVAKLILTLIIFEILDKS